MSSVGSTSRNSERVSTKVFKRYFVGEYRSESSRIGRNKARHPAGPTRDIRNKFRCNSGRQTKSPALAQPWNILQASSPMYPALWASCMIRISSGRAMHQRFAALHVQFSATWRDPLFGSEYLHGDALAALRVYFIACLSFFPRALNPFSPSG